MCGTRHPICNSQTSWKPAARPWTPPPRWQKACGEVRLVWIRDTAQLLRLAVSAALLDEVRAGEALRPAGPLFPMPYDENGDLRSPFS